MKVRATAPLRVDFAGGTIDIPPMHLLHPDGSTINAAVDIFVTAEVETADKVEIISKDLQISASWDDYDQINLNDEPKLALLVQLLSSVHLDQKVRLTIESEAPASSGLGGSSTIALVTIAALFAFVGRDWADRELIEFAKSVETQIVQVPTGYQDYWGPYYGGLRSYGLGLAGDVLRTELGSAEFRTQLQDHLMLVYVGVPHFSGKNNWDLLRERINKVPETTQFFDDLRDSSNQMRQAIGSENITTVAEALAHDWKIRTAMLPGMTTPEIDDLEKSGKTLGIKALRACGAGGGGCVLMIIDPERRAQISDHVSSKGMQVLPIMIQNQGLQVVKIRK